jgi:hypothetical protein
MRGLLLWACFTLKQSILALQPPAVTTEAAVAGNYSVAGYEQPQRVAGTGARYGARVAVELDGQFGVAARLPHWDLLQSAPYLLLEDGATHIQRQLRSPLRFIQLRQYLAQPVAQAKVILLQCCGRKALLQFCL